MAINSQTRTVHTIFIDLPDDVLGKIGSGDQVELVLQSRDGATRAIAVNYGNMRNLIRDH